MPQQPIRIFIAYAREDEPMLKQLRVFLRPLERRNDITMWYDGKIMPGDTWEKSIKDNLHAADIVLLLVSADSINSDYFWDKEGALALARHDKGECHVVPIILKPCGWKHTELAELQALPTDGRPITLWATHDEAFHSVLEGLALLVKKMQDKAIFGETCHQADEAYEQDAWQDARKLYTEALKLHQNGFKPTAETLKQKVEDCSEEIDATDHLQRAQEYENQQKYPEAIAQLQAAIKLKPELQNECSHKLQELTNKVAAAEEQAEKERQQREQAEKVAAAKRQAEKERQQREQAEKVAAAKSTIKMISIPGKDFQLSETPITIEQYLAFCKATNSHLPEWLKEGSKYNIHTGTDNSYKGIGMSEGNSNYPITGVSALDADAFCKWMGGRLPTEQEWEYAAKGGQNYQYAGSDDIDEVAWSNGNSDGRCHPVKQKKTNGYGIYDMSGNVWEWTSSTVGSLRVLRGGSWFNRVQCCRVAYRYTYGPSSRTNHIGFRLSVR